MKGVYANFKGRVPQVPEIRRGFADLDAYIKKIYDPRKIC